MRQELLSTVSVADRATGSEYGAPIGVDPTNADIPDFQNPDVLGDFTGPDGWIYTTRMRRAVRAGRFVTLEVAGHRLGPTASVHVDELGDDFGHGVEAHAAPPCGSHDR